MNDKLLKNLRGLPKTLRVLGKRFKIRILQEDEEEEVDGLMELHKQEVSIRPQEAIGQMQDTSLHEIIHAVDESLALGMTEAQVHQLATGLLGVLKDNRAYSRWLLREEED
jgi:hypothetical protein